MFKTLVDNAARAARAVQGTPHLPPAVEGLRAHAAAFGGTLAPRLGSIAERVAAFARTAAGGAARLKPELDAWRAGHAEARSVILRDLAGLYGDLSATMDSEQAAFKALSAYRDQVLADQRTVATITRDLGEQIAALQVQLRAGRDQLDREQQRLTILRLIPSPLPWVVAEIASLISSGQTLEQRLSELHRLQSELQQRAASAVQAAGVVECLAGQLFVLETAAQNLLNFVSIAHGDMLQTKQSLEGGQRGATPILIEAYLDALKAQSEKILTDLDQT